MQTPSKDKLIADLANNAEDIKEAVAHLSGTLSKSDWNEALQVIFKLKALQADLEAKLKMLAEGS